MILLGALMRLPVLLTYDGPPIAHALNLELMAHVGAYSDISHLFYRDHIGAHPMPYFDTAQMPADLDRLRQLFVPQRGSANLLEYRGDWI